MPVAELHPSVGELAAFTLGSLDEESQASIEAHVAACPSCQERAAVAPNDTLLELLRSVHARPAALKDTVTMAVNEMLAPVRARRAEYARDLGYVRRVLRDGNGRAEAVAAATLDEVRAAMGMRY